MSAEPDGVRVHGGRGGTVATLEDLDRVGALLAGVADRLEEGRGAVVRIDAALDVTWRVESRGAGAVDTALVACRAATRVAGEVRELGTAVRAARDGYATAETGVGDLVRRASVVGASVLGEAGVVVWAGAAVVTAAAAVCAARALVAVRLLRTSPTPLGLVARSLGELQGRPGAAGVVGEAMAGPGLLPAWRPTIGSTQGAVEPVAAFLRGALPGRQPVTFAPVEDLAGQLADLEEVGTALIAGPTALAVARLPGTRVSEPPTSTAEVLGLVDEQYPANGGAPGSVAVQQLVHEDGSRSWVVLVPGTQEMVPGGSNPADMRSNLDLVAGRPDEISRLVEQAMLAAGIRPDEPVLIAGHSQGGIAAARVAADPAVQARFTLTAVVTAGSPVGNVDLPAQTEALHLEHDQDAVPLLEGQENPDTRSRTTVQRDLSASSDPRDLTAASLLDAHALVAYQRTARAAETWGDTSVQGFSDAVSSVLDGAVSARTTVYQGVRTRP